jgi:hypothetical protein
VPGYAYFHKDCFQHSKVNRADTQTHRQHGDIISLLPFFKDAMGYVQKAKVRMRRDEEGINRIICCALKVCGPDPSAT